MAEVENPVTNCVHKIENPVTAAPCTQGHMDPKVEDEGNPVTNWPACQNPSTNWRASESNLESLRCTRDDCMLGFCGNSILKELCHKIYVQCLTNSHFCRTSYNDRFCNNHKVTTEELTEYFSKLRCSRKRKHKDDKPILDHNWASPNYLYSVDELIILRDNVRITPTGILHFIIKNLRNTNKSNDTIKLLQTLDIAQKVGILSNEDKSEVCEKFIKYIAEYSIFTNDDICCQSIHIGKIAFYKCKFDLNVRCTECYEKFLPDICIHHIEMYLHQREIESLYNLKTLVTKTLEKKLRIPISFHGISYSTNLVNEENDIIQLEDKTVDSEENVFSQKYSNISSVEDNNSQIDNDAATIYSDISSQINNSAATIYSDMSSNEGENSQININVATKYSDISSIEDENSLIDNNATTIDVKLYSDISSCEEGIQGGALCDDNSKTRDCVSPVTISSTDNTDEESSSVLKSCSSTRVSVKRKIHDYFRSMQSQKRSQIGDSNNYISVLENEDVTLIKEISDKSMEDCVKNMMTMISGYGAHNKTSDKVIQNLIENIPKFDGNEMLYLNWKNMFIELYNITPRDGNSKTLEFKRYMLSRTVTPAFHFLSELIKEELENLDTEDTDMSWERFLTELDKRFLSPASQQIARNTLSNIQQHHYEKVINYLERCDATLKIAYTEEELVTSIIESQIITNICKGFSDQYLRRKLFQLDIKNYKIFKEKAIELDNMNTKYNLLMNVNSRIEEPMIVDKVRKQNEEVKDIVKAVLNEWKDEQNRNVLIQNVIPSENISKIQMESQPTKDNDKIIADKNSELRQNNNQTYNCHYCGKRGHFIKDCYLRKRDLRNNQQRFQPMFNQNRPTNTTGQDYRNNRYMPPNRRLNRFYNNAR